MKYKVFEINVLGEQVTVIQGFASDGTIWNIPADDANSDYRQYLIDTDGGLPIPDSEPKV